MINTEYKLTLSPTLNLINFWSSSSLNLGTSGHHDHTNTYLHVQILNLTESIEDNIAASSVGQFTGQDPEHQDKYWALNSYYSPHPKTIRESRFDGDVYS